jgi:plastocyanin
MKPFATLITLTGAALLLAGHGARAQDVMEMPGGMDHGHQMEMMEGGQAHAMGHEGHGMGGGASDGSWSYGGRENPEPDATGRWEMAPIGEGGGWTAAAGKDLDALCSAFASDPNVILDRAQQAACAGAAGLSPGWQELAHHESPDTGMNMDHGIMDHDTMDHGPMGDDEGMERHQAALSDGREFVVRMKFDEETGDLYFAPARLEIASGDTVTWIQDDDINAHNVAAYPGRIPTGSEPFEGPLLTEKGQSWSATFGVPGSYYYHCHPHEAVMRGLIVVERESLPGEFREPAHGERDHDHGGEHHEH